jgi:hypothetical protein
LEVVPVLVLVAVTATLRSTLSVIVTNVVPELVEVPVLKLDDVVVFVEVPTVEPVTVDVAVFVVVLVVVVVVLVVAMLVATELATPSSEVSTAPITEVPVAVEVNEAEKVAPMVPAMVETPVPVLTPERYEDVISEMPDETSMPEVVPTSGRPSLAPITLTTAVVNGFTGIEAPSEVRVGKKAVKVAFPVTTLMK